MSAEYMLEIVLLLTAKETHHEPLLFYLKISKIGIWQMLLQAQL